MEDSTMIKSNATRANTPNADRRRLSHGEIVCENRVDTIQVLDGEKWKTIRCKDKAVKMYERFGKTYDRVTKLPAFLVCPLMFDSITHCSDHQDRTFDEPFSFKCENQVSHVDIIDDNDQTIIMKCTNRSFPEPNKYCRQFDLYSGRLVWQVCPLSCPFSGCNQCANKVDKLQVLDKKSKWKHVGCRDKPGKDSTYCRQFNGLTKDLVYLDCPLMCPELSGCL